MADYIESALELLKLAPRYLIAIGIAAAFLLFGSDQFLARLGLKKFTEDYRAWLGLAFVATVSLFVIYVAGEIIAFFRRKGVEGVEGSKGSNLNVCGHRRQSSITTHHSRSTASAAITHDHLWIGGGVYTY